MQMNGKRVLLAVLFLLSIAMFPLSAIADDTTQHDNVENESFFVVLLDGILKDTLQTGYDISSDDKTVTLNIWDRDTTMKAWYASQGVPYWKEQWDNFVSEQKEIYDSYSSSLEMTGESLDFCMSFLNDQDHAVILLTFYNGELAYDCVENGDKIFFCLSPDGDPMENYLKDKGVLSGERVDMNLTCYKNDALSGFKYGNTEIYEYNVNSQFFKDAVEKGTIYYDDVDHPVLAVSDNYIMINEASDELIAAFKDFENQ